MDSLLRSRRLCSFRRCRGALCAVLLLCTAGAVAAQSPAPAPPPQQPASTASADEGQQSSITVRSKLVLVPAVVKTAGGDRVFSLTASDFAVTDNGVPQKLTLEDGTDSQPLALMVVVQVGGVGAGHLADYEGIGPLLEAMIGAVPHHVGVIDFDSQAEVLQRFHPSIERATHSIGELVPGDKGAAIFDALALAVDTLRKEPPTYRRAILLLSETVDHGSHTTLQDALRAIGDTNTAIYALSYGSTRADLGAEAGKFTQSEPNPPGGCMARDPNKPPEEQTGRVAQAWECASELLPPLRLAQMALVASINGMRKNAPATVAELTGGESMKFSNAKSFAKAMMTLSNDVPNRYVLSFRPSAPGVGMHALHLSVNRSGLRVTSRTAYWVDPEEAAAPAAK